MLILWSGDLPLIRRNLSISVKILSHRLDIDNVSKGGPELHEKLTLFLFFIAAYLFRSIWGLSNVGGVHILYRR